MGQPCPTFFFVGLEFQCGDVRFGSGSLDMGGDFTCTHCDFTYVSFGGVVFAARHLFGPDGRELFDGLNPSLSPAALALLLVHAFTSTSSSMAILDVSEKSSRSSLSSSSVIQSSPGRRYYRPVRVFLRGFR